MEDRDGEVTAALSEYKARCRNPTDTHIYSKVIASILKGFKLALMCTNDVIKPARGEKKRLSAVSSRGKYRSCSNVQ